jgi:predicted secreted protein
MVRLVFLAFLALVMPAWAGDRAGVDFVGFSEDGAYFAFEEFGIQDGSGFAYANLYVIDTATDKWVKGTPVRVRVDDEKIGIAQVRANARRQAQPVLDRLGIDAAVEVLALNGDGELAANPGQFRFGLPGYGRDEPRGDYMLSLSSGIVTSPLPCADWFSAPPMGFLLTLDERVVHEETSIPESRGCAQEYRLYGVVQPFGAQAIDKAVAVIAVYPGGFEGPDRRFIAVPLGQ